MREEQAPAQQINRNKLRKGKLCGEGGGRPWDNAKWEREPHSTPIGLCRSTDAKQADRKTETHKSISREKKAEYEHLQQEIYILSREAAYES